MVTDGGPVVQGDLTAPDSTAPDSTANVSDNTAPDSTAHVSEQMLADAVHAAASVVVAALSSRSSSRPAEQWLALADACQSLVNTATAAQDVAVVEVGRRERVWCEDGTVGERLHGPGTVSLDAADLLAPVLGVSHAQAQRRVEQAVRLAAGRVPVPVERGEVAPASGLSGLHAAMAAGHLDGYRAGVVAHELDGAPAEVADAVVAALDGHLGEDAPTMRRRVRRLLVRISPDLLRQRAQRARASTGLRRWVAEPGVDAWFGTFPSEDAATAWAAIDRLAHDYVTDGTCSSVEQARGKALTDLVTGNATIDVHVVLTVPAETCRPDVTADDEYPTRDDADPTADDEYPTRDDADPTAIDERTPPDGAEVPAAEPGPPHEGGCAARPARGVAEPTARPDAQGPLGQPGGPVAAGAPGADPAASPSHADLGEGADLDPARTGCAEDLVEVQGVRPSEPMLVRRAWLTGHLVTDHLVTDHLVTDHLARAPGLDTRDRRARRVGPPRFAPCDPLTGARLDAADDLATHAYRPGPRLAALVRARDGRCRFPGCTVAARFCDLDHVRPWPTGRTSADNLICLCRRHHRIKQAPGWVLRLAPDGTVTLTDPTGRVRTTAPLNALDALVLPQERADVPVLPRERADVPVLPRERADVPVLPRERADVPVWCGADRPAGVPTTATGSPAPPPGGPASPDEPHRARRTRAWSALETHHALHLDHHPPHRRCTSAAALRAARRPRTVPAHVHDPPPF